MFFLQLNMMRNRIEQLDVVAYSDDAQDLLDLIDREKVEPYSENMDEWGTPKVYHKHFRKGGPLEWFNPPIPAGDRYLAAGGADAIFNIGTREEAMQRAGEQWDNLRNIFSHVSVLGKLPG